MLDNSPAMQTFLQRSSPHPTTLGRLAGHTERPELGVSSRSQARQSLQRRLKLAFVLGDELLNVSISAGAWILILFYRKVN